jgi:hypothetical protein
VLSLYKHKYLCFVLLASFFLEVILFQLCFIILHLQMEALPLPYPALPVLWVQFPLGSSLIISFLYYTLFQHNRLLPLSFWWTYHLDLEFHIGKHCYRALQRFLANCSFCCCCPCMHLSCKILWIPYVISHDYLCCKWLYSRLALHAFSLIMLNETNLFDLITVAL